LNRRILLVDFIECFNVHLAKITRSRQEGLI
jgi:hypothetical protein